MNLSSNGVLGAKFDAVLVRAATLGARHAVPRFRYDVVHLRAGREIDAFFAENVVTTEGATDLVNKYFKGSAYTAGWYLGLISGASYTTPPAIGNTAANLSGTGNGWAECSASYAPNYSTPTGTNRGAVTFGSPSGTDPVTLASSATIDFTFSEGGTVKGAFLAVGATRLLTTAPLYSAALFSGDKTVVASDQLKVTVSLTVDLVYTP